MYCVSVMYFNDLGLHSGGIDIPWKYIRGLYICMECRGQSRYTDYIFKKEEIYLGFAEGCKCLAEALKTHLVSKNLKKMKAKRIRTKATNKNLIEVKNNEDNSREGL